MGLDSGSERDISAFQPIELSKADHTPSTFLSTFTAIRQATKSRERDTVIAG